MNARIERPSGWAEKNFAYGWRVVVLGAEPRQVPDAATAQRILLDADDALDELATAGSLAAAWLP